MLQKDLLQPGGMFDFNIFGSMIYIPYYLYMHIWRKFSYFRSISNLYQNLVPLVFVFVFKFQNRNNNQEDPIFETKSKISIFSLSGFCIACLGIFIKSFYLSRRISWHQYFLMFDFRSFMIFYQPFCCNPSWRSLSNYYLKH